MTEDLLNYKYALVQNLGVQAKMTGHRLLITLPSGTISCDPLDYDVIQKILNSSDEDDLDQEHVAESMYCTTLTTMKKIKENNDIDYGKFAKSFPVKNVSSIGVSTIVNLPYLLIFLDQIVAVSVGNVAEE